MLWIQDQLYFSEFFTRPAQREKKGTTFHDLFIKFPTAKNRLINKGFYFICIKQMPSALYNPVSYNLFCEDLPDNYYPYSNVDHCLILSPSVIVILVCNLFVSCFSCQTVHFLEAVRMSYLSLYPLFHLKSLASYFSSKNDCLNKG